MKFVVALLLFLFPAILTHAQDNSIVISGVDRDSSSSEALVGVHVLHVETREGVITDQYGRFVSVASRGRVTLQFNYVGFEVKQVTFTTWQDTSIVVYLSPGVVELDEIQISDSEASIPATSASIVHINPEEVKRIPMMGGDPDIIKALQLMPGIHGGREGSAGLWVRGGGPDQNLILLDGTPVYNASHALGFLSAFNPDVVRNVTVTKGPGAARFGGRLSSVVDVSLREGDLNKRQIHGNIGTIAAIATIEGPIRKGQLSYLLSVRRTYLDLLFLAFQPPKEKFGYFFTDVVGKLSYVSNKHGVYLSLYGGEDRLWTRTTESRSTLEERLRGRLKWGNLTGSLRWQGVLSSNILAQAALSRTAYGLSYFERSTEERFANTFTFTDEVSVSSRVADWSLSGDLSAAMWAGSSLRAGGIVTAHQFTPSSSSVQFAGNEPVDEGLASTQKQKENAFAASLYVDADLKLSARTQVAGGIRLSSFYSRGTSYFTPEPRLAVSYQLNTASTVEASVTRAAQYVHLLSRNGIGIPLDLWLPSTELIKPETAWQYTIGGTHQLAGTGIQFGVDLYYKQLSNVVQPVAGSSFAAIDATNWESRIETGDGVAYGLEILARKRTGRLTGWISYTLARSTRTLESIDNGTAFPARFQRLHDISITASYQRTKQKSISVTWVFNSGEAIWLPSRRLPAVEDFPLGYQTDPFYGPDLDAYAYGARNSSRAPSYHRLDLAFQRTKPIRNGKGTGTFTFALYNVYLQRNPFFLTPKVDDQGRITYERFSPFLFIPGISYDFKF